MIARNLKIEVSFIPMSGAFENLSTHNLVTLSCKVNKDISRFLKSQNSKAHFLYDSFKMSPQHCSSTLIPGIAEIFVQSENEKAKLSDLTFLCKATDENALAEVKVFHSFRLLFAGLSPFLRQAFEENQLVDHSDVISVSVPASYESVAKFHNDLLNTSLPVESSNENQPPIDMSDLLKLFVMDSSLEDFSKKINEEKGS